MASDESTGLLPSPGITFSMMQAASSAAGTIGRMTQVVDGYGGAQEATPNADIEAPADMHQPKRKRWAARDARLNVTNKENDWYGMLLKSILGRQASEFDARVKKFQADLGQSDEDLSQSNAFCLKIITCKLCIVGKSRALYWGLLACFVCLTAMDISITNYGEGLQGYALPFKICILLPFLIGAFFAVRP